MKTIVEQLNEVYWREEYWQSHRETQAGITNYHQAMLDKGNLICYVEDGELLGYCEFWRITFEQFGRIICQDRFIAPLEDTISGKICYVANVWIRKDKRFGKVFTDLKDRFFGLNNQCDYFVGEALRKRTGLVKVFSRKEFFDKYVRKE